MNALAAAQAARGAGNYQAAAIGFAAVLHDAPECLPALLSLGAMRLGEGDGAAALPMLRQAVALDPAHAEVLHSLGLALLLTGAAEAALSPLLRAHALMPDSALCARHLAEAALTAGQATPILALLQAEAEKFPRRASALTGIFVLHMATGSRVAAMAALQAAAWLAPDDVTVARLWADALAHTTRQHEAEAALRAVLRLCPDDEDATMALSVVLLRAHRYAESVSLLEALLARTDFRVGPLCNLATARTALGEAAAAAELAREAISLAPRHPAPRRTLCNTLPYVPGIDGATLLAAAREAADLHAPARPAVLAARPCARRLRLGLVSGTLRAHPVGWFTLAGFEQLDRARFDIVCLSPNAAEDAMGRRFAARASDWVDIAGLDDAALAAQGRELALDIAIDLGGYGDFGRLPAFAHRLAPVQVKWVGMQNHSTGMTAIDWMISDRWQTPDAMAGLYSESLLVMPDGYVCYTPPAAPDVTPPPALTRGIVTFGCFNNLAKINERVIALWARVLRAVPDSRLLLKAHQFNNADTRARITALFEACGITASRLECRGSSPHAELLRQYSDVDFVLDPMPYSGGLTTVEALWMGVPTLTLPGEMFASRHSCSHMSNVGLSDWVVTNEDEYIDQAVARAHAISDLAALRAGLRARIQASPLCDGARFGRALGAALDAAWDCAVSGRTPKILHVSL